MVSTPFVVAPAGTANGQDVSVNGTPGANNSITVTAGGGGNGSLDYTQNGGRPVNDNNVNTFTYNGTGDDAATVNVPSGGNLASDGVFINNTDSLTVNGDGQTFVTPPRYVNSVDPQVIGYANVRTITINGAVAVDALPGPDTADRAAALAGLTGNARFVQTLYLDDLGRVGDLTNIRDAGSWVRRA